MRKKSCTKILQLVHDIMDQHNSCHQLQFPEANFMSIARKAEPWWANFVELQNYQSLIALGEKTSCFRDSWTSQEPFTQISWSGGCHWQNRYPWLQVLLVQLWEKHNKTDRNHQSFLTQLTRSFTGVSVEVSCSRSLATSISLRIWIGKTKVGTKLAEDNSSFT